MLVKCFAEASSTAEKVESLKIFAVNACPWIHRRVQAVWMNASNLAHITDDEKIHWLQTTAYTTNSCWFRLFNLSTDYKRQRISHQREKFKSEHKVPIKWGQPWNIKKFFSDSRKQMNNADELRRDAHSFFHIEYESINEWWTCWWPTFYVGHYVVEHGFSHMQLGVQDPTCIVVFSSIVVIRIIATLKHPFSAKKSLTFLCLTIKVQELLMFRDIIKLYYDLCIANPLTIIYSFTIKQASIQPSMTVKYYIHRLLKSRIWNS